MENTDLINSHNKIGASFSNSIPKSSLIFNQNSKLSQIVTPKISNLQNLNFEKWKGIPHYKNSTNTTASDLHQKIKPKEINFSSEKPKIMVSFKLKIKK